jgi:hypothetical protein
VPSLFTVVTQPNRIEPPVQVMSRRVLREQALTNNSYDLAVAEPVTTLPYRVFLDSRTTIRALETWFRSVKGRYVSFYIPTYVADLPLLADIGASDTTFNITAVGYTANLYPYPARKRLAFISAAGTITERAVTGSVDNGDGTETITIASSLGAAFDRETGLVCFSLLVRLASDEMVIRRSTATLAECVLDCIELPEEA